MSKTNSKLAALFGENSFIFLDDRPWPYLVTMISDEWWLCYWSDGNKNFVTMRKLTLVEVSHFRAFALPTEKAEFYAEVTNKPLSIK